MCKVVLDNAYALAALNAASTMPGLGGWADLIRHKLLMGVLNLDELRQYSQNILGDPEYHNDHKSRIQGFVARAITANTRSTAELVVALCGEHGLEDFLPEIRFYAGTEITADEPFFTPFNGVGLLGVRKPKHFMTFKRDPKQIIGLSR